MKQPVGAVVPAKLSTVPVGTGANATCAASDILAPLDGEIIEINEALSDEPSKVNEDPMGEAWFFKMKPSDPSQVEDYMTEDEYKKLIS